jgi:uncharacterized protein (TIGR03083 family)
VDYAAALIEQNRLLADITLAADPSTPVPTCPGWTVLQLLRHVGRGDRWAAQIIREHADGYLDPRQVPDGRPADDPAAARDWLLAGPVTLLDAIQHTGPDTPVWTFLGPRPAAWWTRRRLHEATIHRADAALATERTYDLAPELAADGIDEWLDRLAVELPSATSVALDDARTIVLNATDLTADEAGWLIRGLTHGIAWAREQAEDAGHVRVTGTAKDLLLALFRRADEGDIQLDGDKDIWRQWLAATPL